MSTPRNPPILLSSGLADLAARSLHIFDAETAHGLSIKALSGGWAARLGLRYGPEDPVLKTELVGLSFPNVIGLAAGYDKNAEVPGALFDLGFGFVECGTVTPLPQAGNPRPRLFRLTPDQAVINRMGFNNDGLEAFAARLEAARRAGLPGPIGANIGANKDATDRIADYVTGLERLWGLPDYFTVNISSPNTPGLRALQGRAPLDELLGRLAEARQRLQGGAGRPTPVFLKIAPDLSEGEIRDAVEAVADHGFEGLIVSNTTLERPSDLVSIHQGEAGGLSGAPAFAVATRALETAARVVRGLGRQSGPNKLVLIGAGGVDSAETAWAKIRAGADLVQLYSALVYGGPGLVARLRTGLKRRLEAEGFRQVSEAVGTGLRD
ncbi:MAG: quinone-dependent dihydroorotate dehydrogenase [Asticcacaulis sp.]